MWLSKIENVNTVKAIYKEKEPSLNNITLHKVTILPEKCLDLKLVFDIEDMPDNLPLKWKIRKANAVEFQFDFSEVSIKHISITNNSHTDVKLIINKLDEETKQVIGFDKLGNCIFDFNANWIYIQYISGYYNPKIATLKSAQ